ncbi:hypothetical protein Pan216_08280 [Planctomycetes bacterium Pan216]|uniref:Uncharacterized protein n=1 Tax=Kolteria novifilia TaxID=2527975 RepID=A0A518AZ31_9BACT|nr:hypothetical protein Pan216_08280 [Planctomycetes bacterium Pan216]
MSDEENDLPAPGEKWERVVFVKPLRPDGFGFSVPARFVSIVGCAETTDHGRKVIYEEEGGHRDAVDLGEFLAEFRRAE